MPEGPAGPGTAATVNVGTTTSASGGNADVQNVGSENAAVLNSTRGSWPGWTRKRRVGTVTTNTGNLAVMLLLLSITQGTQLLPFGITPSIFQLAPPDRRERASLSLVLSMKLVNGSCDYPAFNGDIVVDSNGDGGQTVPTFNVGPIRGPEGPAGDAVPYQLQQTQRRLLDQPASVVVVNNGIFRCTVRFQF